MKKIILLLFSIIPVVSFALGNVEKSITVTLGKSFNLDPIYDVGITSYWDQQKASFFKLVVEDELAFSTEVLQYGNSNHKVVKLTPNKKGVYLYAIWIRYNDNFYCASYHITIDEVTQIGIPSEINMTLGENYKIKPKLYPDGVESTITYAIGNSSVATVTKEKNSIGGYTNNGIVTAIGVGTTTITCTASNGVSAQSTIRVNPILANNVFLNHQELTIEEGCTETLVASVSPDNTTNKEVVWSSSDPAVVLVGTNGVIAGLKAGWAVITATTTDGSNKSATCLVNVTAKPIYIESISLNKESLSMTKGEETQLSARLYPTNVTNDRIVWKSSDTSCVSVDEYGTLKALNAGDAVISAETSDGTNLTVSCKVTVKEKDISSFDNIIYFNTTTGIVGSAVTLPLMMDNKDNITAIQFDLALPNGMEVLKNEEVNAYDIRFNAEASRTNNSSHTISSALQDDKSIRVLCFSVGLDLFSGNSGAILDIPFSIADNMDAGKYYLELKNIVLTGKDGEKYSIDNYSTMINVATVAPGDVNADGAMDVVDVVAIANYILGKRSDVFVEDAADMNADGIIDVVDIVALANGILGKAEPSLARKRTIKNGDADGRDINVGVEIAPFVMEPGQKSKVLTLDMNNYGTEITAFQLDLSLPEGLEIDLNRRGTAYNLTFNTDADRTDATYHTLSSAKQENGDVRILCYSLSLATFWGENGAIINIPVTASSDMLAGIYDFSIKNIVMTQTDETKIVTDEYRGSIVIGDGGDIRSIKLYGTYSGEIIKDFSEAFSSNEAITSLDLEEASIKDGIVGKLTTANPNTLLYMVEEQSLGNNKNIVVGDQCEILELTDNMPFNAPKNFVAHEAIYSRNVPAQGWYSLCLPFAPTTDPQVKIEKFVDFNETEQIVYFEEEALPKPYVPYIFSTNGNNLCLRGSFVEIEATPNEIHDGAFVGNISEFQLPCIAGYYALKPDGSGFSVTEATAYVSPFHAVINTNGATHGLRNLSIIHNGNITDCINTLNDAGNQHEDIIFNIQGIRTTMNKKGVYIRNGQKTIK